MKTKMIVLVGMLFTQIVFTSNNVYGEDVMAIMKDRHKVHLITHKEANLLVACGYIEESQLFLNFNSSLENRKIQVVDSETGQTVFDDTITGTSFSIFLERDSDSFDIYIGR